MQYYREWIPPEVESIVKEFHARPQLWFIGHIVKYLLRMNENMTKSYVETKIKLLGHTPPSPLLGIHARGDDSKTEREIVYLDYFMQHIPSEFKTIYLATDDAKNLATVKRFENSI